MKKLINFILENITFFILSLFYLLLRFIYSIKYFQKDNIVKFINLLLFSEIIIYIFTAYVKIKISPPNYMFLLGYLILLVLFGYFFIEMNFSEKNEELRRKFWNSFKIKNIPINYLDYFILFIISLISAYFIFHKLFNKPITKWNILILLLVNVIIVLIGKLLNCISELISLLANKINKDSENIHSYEIPIRIVPDKPITNTAEDILNRTEFIEDLGSQIQEIPLNTDSFVFGLYGSWGEGKSSVINLLQNKLKKEHIIVNFDPWHFKDQEVITNAFYSELDTAINKEYIFPKLHKTIKKYLQMISFGIKHYGITLNPIVKSESIEETKKRIESYLDIIPKKIIIFIDNIDRLQKNEILLIFQLVRLSSNFRNTVYILSFDREAVIRQINDDKNPADGSFIDKIVQKPVLMPPIEEDKLKGILLEKLSNFPGKGGLKNLSKYIETDLKAEYNSIWKSIGRNFKTIRHIKIYLNSLYSTLPPIEDRINFRDLFIVETIRVFFPEIFNIIYRYPLFFLPIQGTNDKELNYKFKERGNIITEVVNLLEKTNDIKKLNDIFSGLFPFMATASIGGIAIANVNPGMQPRPPLQQYNSTKSINSRDYFKHYFTLVK